MSQDDPRITAYITKYALTVGIQEVEARICVNTSADMIAYKTPSNYLEQHVHGEGRDWHRTREEAVKRAEEMRAAKLKSIAKQVTRLEAMTF